MTKSLLFQVAASLAIVVMFVCGQQALAQEVPHHYRVQMVHRENPDRTLKSNPPPPDGLYGIGQSFAAYALDGSGADEWPSKGVPNSLMIAKPFAIA